MATGRSGACQSAESSRRHECADTSARRGSTRASAAADRRGSVPASSVRAAAVFACHVAPQFDRLHRSSSMHQLAAPCPCERASMGAVHAYGLLHRRKTPAAVYCALSASDGIIPRPIPADDHPCNRDGGTDQDQARISQTGRMSTPDTYQVRRWISPLSVLMFRLPPFLWGINESLRSVFPTKLMG